MPNGRVKDSPPTSKHLLKFMRENAEGIVPEEGVALYPLPDTSLQEDAPSVALSARSQTVGRHTCALLINAYTTRMIVNVMLFIMSCYILLQRYIFFHIIVFFLKKFRTVSY